jgi:hypothetical protein
MIPAQISQLPPQAVSSKEVARGGSNHPARCAATPVNGDSLARKQAGVLSSIGPDIGCREAHRNRRLRMRSKGR